MSHIRRIAIASQIRRTEYTTLNTTLTFIRPDQGPNSTPAQHKVRALYVYRLASLVATRCLIKKNNYSDSLPPTYLGNMVLFNRVTLQLDTLISSTTSVGKVAEAIRSRAQGIDKATLQEAYGIIRSVADLGEPKLRFSKVVGWDMTISPLNAFGTIREINFGDNVFENRGQMDDTRGL
ncbi:hypothetical protein V8C42DRAFT_190959 [Trichoderma barbatum]